MSKHQILDILDVTELNVISGNIRQTLWVNEIRSNESIKANEIEVEKLIHNDFKKITTSKSERTAEYDTNSGAIVRFFMIGQYTKNVIVKIKNKYITEASNIIVSLQNQHTEYPSQAIFILYKTEIKNGYIEINVLNINEGLTSEEDEFTISYQIMN